MKIVATKRGVMVTADGSCRFGYVPGTLFDIREEDFAYYMQYGWEIVETKDASTKEIVEAEKEKKKTVVAKEVVKKKVAKKK